MNEVDDKALDMAAIMILISHNHQVWIPQRLDILFRVGSIELETHDLHQIYYLFILHNLGMRCIVDIQRLTLQWKHPIVVLSYHTETRYSQRLCGVTLGDNRSAIL